MVVICIEEEWAKKVADGIRASGKPVSYFGIEQHGDHDTIMRASKLRANTCSGRASCAARSGR